jgi:pepsin A
MILQKLLPQNVFSVYLSNQENDDSSAILFGGTDTQYYTGSFQYAKVILPSYWLVSMDSIAVDGKTLLSCDFCPLVVGNFMPF